MATSLDDYMFSAGANGGDISRADYQAEEGGGFFSSIGSGVAAAVKGTVLTGVSAAYGLANTVPLIANAVGGQDTMEYLSTLDAANKLDQVFNTGEALSDFYQEHSQGVELAGAIAGSIIPGGLAVKGAKLGFGRFSNYATRLAESNSATIVGSMASWYNKLAPTSAKTRILQSAYTDIINRSTAITHLMPFDRFRFALASGGALAVESAVFETASIMTQKANPTYSDIETLGDFTKAVGTAAVFGGGLGGIFGAAFYKGARFNPVAGDSTELSLRETANIMGDARTRIIERADFGEKLKNIASGSKIAGMADDRLMTEELMNRGLNDLFDKLPAKSLDDAIASSKIWFNDRQRYVDTALKDLVLDIVKTKNSDLGEVIYKQLIAKGDDGAYPLVGEKLSQVFGNMTAATRLFTQPFGQSIGLKAVANYSEEALQKYGDLINQSEIGQKVASLNAQMKTIRDYFELNGFNKNPVKSALPPEFHTHLTALDRLKREMTKINSDDFKRLQADPTMMTPAIIAKYKIPQSLVDQIKTITDIGEQKSIGQFFDLVAKRHTSEPTAMLGDFVARVGAPLKYKGGNVLTDDGAQVLLKNAKETMSSGNTAVTDIESQVRWSIANQFLPHGKNAGKGIDLPGGALDMYKLAATIDKGGPIIIGGQEVSKDIALQELTKGKKWMFDHARRILGYSDERARMYADLPAEGDIIDWAAKSGRVNDFMQRRNIVTAYEKAVNISEIELKTMEGLRGLIEDAQIAARNATYGIAANAGVVIPEAIRGAADSLANHGIYGSSPVDMANRVGPGALTTANGRLWSMQTQAAAMGTWLRDQTIKLQTASRAALASPTSELLKSAKSLAAFSLVHKKATSTGVRFVDSANVEKSIGLPAGAIMRILGKSEGGLWISKQSALELQKLAAAETGLDAQGMMDILLHQIDRNTMHVDDELLSNFLKAQSAENGKVFKTQLNLRGARGYDTSGYMDGELYFPPLDVTKNPYFAMVRDSTRSAIDGSPRYSFVHARSSMELKELVNKIERDLPETSVFTRAQIEADKKLSGEFDWAQSFSSYSIDNKLHSKNLFGEYQLRNPQEIMEESANHINRMHTVNMRETLRNMTGDFLDSMRAQSDTVDGFAKSTHGKAFARGDRGAAGDNVYSQIARTILDVSPSENADGILGLFSRGQHALTDFVDNVATKARDGLRDQGFAKGYSDKKVEELVSYLNEAAPKLGMDMGEFSTEMARAMARLYNPAGFSKYVQSRLNAISVFGTLMADFVNPIVQSLALPISINSSIRRLLKDAPPEVMKNLEDITVTGKAARLGARAAIDYWADIPMIAKFEKYRLGEKLSQTETIELANWQATKQGAFFKEMADSGLLPPSAREAMIEINQVTDIKDLILGKGADWGKKFLRYASAPTRYAETFQRYAALKVADGLAEVAKLNPTDRYILMHSFAAQSNGVYTAAQRPGLFQGAIGASFGLYKSYAINMMQALMRHIEDRDLKAVLGFAGLQGTIFGGQSIPGAGIVNKYIQAQNDQDQRDLYSTADLILGKSAGNTMLYGLGSAVSGIGMYSRGDFNFDFGSPLDPKSYPAVNQFITLAESMAKAGQLMNKGGGFVDSSLYALSHQSLSRPVARVAEYAQGGPITSGGVRPYMIDDYQLWHWGFAIRAMGAKPFNEAVLSDAYYRENQHRFDQAESMKNLRISVRNSLASGDDIDLESLAREHMKAGGNPKNLRQWYQSQYRSANQEGVEKLRKEAEKKGWWLRAQQLDGGD